jgi:large subunit ribosomal protein L4
MPKVKVYNMEGKELESLELNQDIFASKIKEHILHEEVLMHLARKRKGTASTKTRGEVKGGGAKPWKQKGTGRARAGSLRSPIWRGGGTTFGPRPRDYSYSLPKKVRRLALKSALSSKVKDKEVIILDSLKLEKPKTKGMFAILNKFRKGNSRLLLVIGKHDQNIERASRNIPAVKVLIPEIFTSYDLLNCQRLILTKDALKGIEKRLAGK